MHAPISKSLLDIIISVLRPVAANHPAILLPILATAQPRWGGGRATPANAVFTLALFSGASIIGNVIDHIAVHDFTHPARGWRRRRPCCSFLLHNLILALQPPLFAVRLYASTTNRPNASHPEPAPHADARPLLSSAFDAYFFCEPLTNSDRLDQPYRSSACWWCKQLMGLFSRQSDPPVCPKWTTRS
ncbi:hypothetical protein IF1G_04971 [Cordyceps javanica]|uniref:Uncharacterized protein n=1 Tax=Cordyceps javanica TaxID=43265 RepID=A0A545V3U5_9HYPO|nr:hypothetical protein IF1G_04971 [Cordyceps javanica]